MTPTKLFTQISWGIFSTLIGFFGTLALIIVGLFFATIPWHNFTLWRMEHSLASSIQHPLDSHFVERKKFFGTRYTDTEECTYAVGEIRATELSRKELLDEYKNRSTGIFSFTPAEPIHVAIVEDDTPLPLDNPADAWIHDFLPNIDQNKKNTIYYLVYLYKEGKAWLGDIRCFD